MALKEGSAEFKLLKALGKFYEETDLSNEFSVEEQASPLSPNRITIDDLVQSTGLKREKIRTALKNVERQWELPEVFPQGIFSEEEARIRRLARQERLRKDNGGYKQDQLYLFCAELGLSSTIGNPDIYKGLALVLEAKNYIPKLKTFIFQGGAIPENPFLWTKIGHERAKQVSKSRLAEETGEFESEIEDKELKKEAEKKKEELRKFFESEELSDQDWEHYIKYIKDTPNIYEDLSKEGAFEIAPLIKVIPDKVKGFYQHGLGDYYNKNQLLEAIIVDEKRRKAQEEKVAKLEGLKLKRHEILEEYAKFLMYKKTGDFLEKALKEIKIPENKEMREVIKENIYKSHAFKRKIEEFKKEYSEIRRIDRPIGFRKVFEDITEEYSSGAIKSKESLIETKEHYDRASGKELEKTSKIEKEIAELEIEKEKLEEEKRAGASWLTKKKAITNEEAKVTEYIVKKRYNKFLEDLFGKHLRSFTGKKHKINILSSQKITLSEQAIPGSGAYRRGYLFSPDLDPSEIIGYVDIGRTSIALIPNPDFQRSNEPKEGDLRRLKCIYNDSLASLIAKEPKKKDKYGRLANAGILFSGWGAGGLEIQPQQAIGETWVKEEYVVTPRRVVFIKGAVMHDAENLSNVFSRCPSRTWELKRYNKGGFQAGALFYIDKADGMPEAYFAETNLLKEFGEKYYKQYNEIKTKLEDKKLKGKAREELKADLERIYNAIREKTELQPLLLNDDTHAGSSTVQGRISPLDVEKATLTNASDVIGYPSQLKLTEMLHGHPKIMKSQMDTKRQGMASVGPEKNEDKYYLQKALENKDITKNEYDVMLYLYGKEQEALEVRWRLDEQLELHSRVSQPCLEDMMLNGTKVIMGNGNHCPGEALIVSKLYRREFKNSGTLEVMKNPGEGKAYGQVYLNSELKADFYHKTCEGSTEGSDVWKQIQGTRTDSIVVLTADRHHGGLWIKGNKVVYLNFGKQPENAHVHSIGKCASLRGDIIAYVPKTGKAFFYGVKFVDDIANNKIIAWDTESRILGKMHRAIERYRRIDGRKEMSIEKEAQEKKHKIYR